jgi:hypothetical protein
MEVIFKGDRCGLMNYWERRNSFWNTGKGLALMVFLAIVFIVSAVVGLNLFILPYPIVESFDAKPAVINQGSSLTLSWSVVGADKVEIDPGIGTVGLQGSRQVSPFVTTTYNLTAWNGTVVRDRIVKIMVKPQH